MNKNATIIFNKPNEVVIENMEMPVPRDGQLVVKTCKSLISMGTELTILGRNNVVDGSIWDQYGTFPVFIRAIATSEL